MNCQAVERYMDAVLDQEADPSVHMSVEQHLASCALCSERLQFARWLKARVKGEARVEAPAALRARLRGSLAEERAEDGFAFGAGVLVRGDTSWRSTFAVAAMALLVFGLGGALKMKGQQMSAGIAPLFEDVVRAHQRPYPADVARREQVPAYFAEKVGFPVRSVEFGDPGVRFLGARHAEVGGRRAVTLHYEARGRKMTVVAFRPPAHAQGIGELVDTEGRTLRYVRVGGHLVPLVEHAGVLYAVVGDLEPEDGLRLAARASLQ